jgi:hypothetical protein
MPAPETCQRRGQAAAPRWGNADPKLWHTFSRARTMEMRTPLFVSRAYWASWLDFLACSRSPMSPREKKRTNSAKIFVRKWQGRSKDIVDGSKSHSTSPQVHEVTWCLFHQGRGPLGSCQSTEQRNYLRLT